MKHIIVDSCLKTHMYFDLSNQHYIYYLFNKLFKGTRPGRIFSYRAFIGLKLKKYIKRPVISWTSLF